MISTADAAWAISYITDEHGVRDGIQPVLDAGCVLSLVRLLGHDKNSIVVPAITLFFAQMRCGA